MTDPKLSAKARAILARRSAPSGISFYLKHAWRRHIFLTLAYTTLSLAFWHLGYSYLAVGIAAYFLGRAVRDFRWWSVLSKEWPTTVEFIDWAKVERIAREAHV